MSAPSIVLASASPRRAALIRMIGLPYRLLPQDLDEPSYATPDPFVTPLAVARAKALAASSAADKDHEVIVAADTVVISDGAVLGKPPDADEAIRTLQSLRDRTHSVATGVWLQWGQLNWGAVVSTVVSMRAYTDQEIGQYVQRGQPFDKAGGYAAQDAEFHPASNLEGCFLNVVGLPVCALVRGLEYLGVVTEAVPNSALTPPCALCDRGRLLTRIE